MSTVNGAHSDNINQQFSILGVIGTAGTADVGGTALTLPVGVNPDNGAMYVDSLGEVTVSNTQKKFRDGFALPITQPDSTVWDLVSDDSNGTTGHIITQGGNAFGAAYLRMSLSPFDTDSGVSITSKDTFEFPLRAGFGISASQRIVGQEIGMELVGVDTSNVVDNETPIADISMPASVTVTTANTCPIVTATPHGLHGGDRIVIYGCYDSRVNAGPLVVTVLTATSFSVPITLAVATYTTTGGYIKWTDPVAYAKNATSLLCENATVTDASFVTRRNGSSMRLLSSTISTTTSTRGNISPYTDAFLCPANHELYTSLEEISYRSWLSDGVAMANLGKWTQAIPDETINYKIRIRCKNLKCLTVPVARILTATKTGTTTATFETDVAHGLTVGDFVQVYGVRANAAAEFPNLTTAVVVTGTSTATSFTCICGTAASISSTGGVVWRVQGGVTAPGVIAGAIQSISRTSNILTVIGSATWATPLPGEYYQLWGMDAGGAAHDGAYKVLRVSTTTLELESIGDDFVSTNCGGAVFKRTDVRVHFVRVLGYTRLIAEISGGRGNTTDINNSVPVSMVAGNTLATVTTVTTVADVTRLNNLGTSPNSVNAYMAANSQLNLLAVQGNIINVVT